MIFIMRVYIETYGCASNQNDSTIMAGLLESSGFQIVSSLENAEAAIINTCIVKHTTKNKILHRIEELAKSYKGILVIAGCMPDVYYDEIKAIAPNARIISTNNITEIVKIFLGKKEIISGNRKPKVCLPKNNNILRKPVNIVEIQSGCNYCCTFCATKFAKHSSFSYPPKKIVEEIANMHKAGCKEFWITGQDIACYEYNGVHLPDLIDMIIRKVKGKYFIRLGMMHPVSLGKIKEKMIDVFKNEHIFKFLHLPLQSGSNKILRKMGRGHTLEEFLSLVKEFRNLGITLWTDVIAGFPEESEDDFAKTIEAIKKIKPDFTNISSFSSHPMTKASKMKQIPSEIKKERTRKLTKIVESICLERNKTWVNWSGMVFIDEIIENKKHGRNWVARNYAYKPIVLKENVRLGEFVNVKVVDAKPTHLVGITANRKL